MPYNLSKIYHFMNGSQGNRKKLVYKLGTGNFLDSTSKATAGQTRKRCSVVNIHWHLYTITLRHQLEFKCRYLQCCVLFGGMQFSLLDYVAEQNVCKQFYYNSLLLKWTIYSIEKYVYIAILKNLPFVPTTVLWEVHSSVLRLHTVKKKKLDEWIKLTSSQTLC